MCRYELDQGDREPRSLAEVVRAIVAQQRGALGLRGGNEAAGDGI